MDTNLAGTYMLIYSFLCKHSHTKAAAAVKKAAKKIAIFKEGVDIESPSLDVIIKEWKAIHAKANLTSSADEQSESSSSSNDSESDSHASRSDSDLDDSSSKKKKQNEQNSPMMAKAKASSSDSANLPGSRVKSGGKTSQTDVKPSQSVQGKESRETSSNSQTQGAPQPKSKKKKEMKEPTLSPGSDLDSKSKSETASTGSASGVSKISKKTKTGVKNGEGPLPGSNEATQVAKKRRTDESGAAHITATVKAEEPTEFHPQADVKAKRKMNTPFQRINPDKVASHVVQDNKYTAKAAPNNDYGARAHNDLIVTRGAGFRKEKNKKKRGSYSGGIITLESHSFKFD